MSVAQDLSTPLARIVGVSHVSDRETSRREYSGDMSWISIAAAAHGRALSCQDVTVRPSTTEDVAAIIRLANDLRVPVTPRGGGSGVQGAANADRGGILLDLRRMTRIRAIDEQSLVATVEAGYVCRDLEAWLNARGLTFTHYPASTEWATIGGALAARGSGVLSTRYGKIEDHVLSVEFVTPTGDIVTTPVVPRHAAGPELTQMLIGSEGVLGVITAVAIKIRRLPVTRLFATYGFESLADGIEAGRRMMTTGLRPPVLRLYDAAAAAHSLSRAVEEKLETATMVFSVEGDHELLARAEMEAARQICVSLNGRDLGDAIGDRWWSRRYVFYYPPFAPELPSIWCTMDVVADFAHIRAVYDAVTDAIHHAVDPRWNLQLVTHFSHWYEWGSMIYPRFKIPVGPDDLDEAMALHDSVVRAATHAALGAGAVLNDHHGVGMRLAPYMKDQYGDAGMRLLQNVKRALDPNNILCPGKLGLE